jgi:predicted DNA-binding transcriptional regulator YafY
MPAGPGRDPVKAMMRLVRIMAALHGAGAKGKAASDLIEVAGYGEGDPNTQLKRDLNHLAAQGWLIENTTDDGGQASYRMVSGDNRLRLRLTDEHRAALQRAVILAKRADIAKGLGLKPAELPTGVGSEVLPHAHSRELNLALQALRLRSRLHFTYKGKPRVVDPGAVRHVTHQWYLTGIEDGGDKVKQFVVGRMSGVELDPPGSAQQSPEVERIRLHPLNWEIDPPTEVTLRVAAGYVPDVGRWLRDPDAQSEQGDEVEMTYVVTHRAAFRARIYQLGTRVQIVGPGEFRNQVLADLRHLVGL